ncbi:MAG: hypothetical protein H0X43_10735 [Nitrosospira sp.]|nr:hypothetical protein [Nitrosospira sp.]
MNKMGATFVAGFLLGLILETAVAGPPILIDKKTGKYLGNLSSNPHDPNSTSNPYGRYGSEYSQDSINNPYGQYGSPYSQDSANNPYAPNPPAIVSPTSPGIGIQPLQGF